MHRAITALIGGLAWFFLLFPYPALGQQAPSLTFIVNQPDFCPGERVSVELAASPGNSETALDLYVVIELPDGQLLYLQSNPFKPFATELAAFMTGIVPTEESFPIIDFVATSELEGFYTLTAAYIRAGRPTELLNIVGDIERISLEILGQLDCGTREQPEPDPPAVAVELVSLTLTPSTLTLANVGDTAQFNTVATFSDGSSRGVNDAAMWSSSLPGVVFVNELGQVAALAPGQATITASFDGMSATATVTIPEPPRLVSLSITPGSVELSGDQTQQLRALATFSDGRTEDVTARATWSSSNPAIVFVNGTGGVAGIGAGQASVTASFGGFTGTASVAVPLPNIASALCVNIAGNWRGSWSETYCNGDRNSGSWAAIITSTCSITARSNTGILFEGTTTNNIVNASAVATFCGTLSAVGTISGNSISGTYSYSLGGGGSWSGSKQ